MMPVLINDVPVSCINHAAIVSHVPAIVILSVIKKENGRNADAIKNKNGTVDYGVMQINSTWLPKIAAFGFTKEDIQYDACKNVLVGSWILSQGIAEGKNIWTGIGNYHSHTPYHNRNYRSGVYKNYEKISFLLNN